MEECQSAYQENFSTETALLKVKTYILDAIDKKEVMCLVMLDLSATFDTVNHHLLLNGLKYRFGVCDLALAWLESYLTNRTQSVVIQNEDGYTAQSAKKPLTQGIPQGSILGPILFNLFVAPLGELCRAKGVSFQGYADDTQNYLSFWPMSGSQNNQVECITKLENCIEAVWHWMQTNFLKLNENKAEFIILGLSKQLKKVGNITIMIGEDIIPNVPTMKNLGIFLDAELKHTIHINKLTSHSFSTLHNISRVRCLLDQETTKILEQALILSKLDYCNSLLLGTLKYNIAKLQRIQNMSCRMIYQLPKYSTISTYLAQLHWLKISEMVISQLPHTRSFRLTNRGLLYTTKSRTEFVHSSSFKSMGACIWNTLPANIKNSNNIDIFTTRLKTHLFRISYQWTKLSFTSIFINYLSPNNLSFIILAF